MKEKPREIEDALKKLPRPKQIGGTGNCLLAERVAIRKATREMTKSAIVRRNGEIAAFRKNSCAEALAKVRKEDRSWRNGEITAFGKNSYAETLAKALKEDKPWGEAPHKPAQIAARQRISDETQRTETPRKETRGQQKLAKKDEAKDKGKGKLGVGNDNT